MRVVLVLMLTVEAGPGKLALAPLAGAVKVTLSPPIPLPNWSDTWATSALVKAALICAD